MNSKAIKRQLLAAIAMVLVAAIALGSSTYAWFVSNNAVTATGIDLSTTSSVPNLYITSAGKTTDAAAAAGTNPSKLFPVSTNNATNFYETKHWVTGNGKHPVADEYQVAQTHEEGKTVYADYTFKLGVLNGTMDIYFDSAATATTLAASDAMGTAGRFAIKFDDGAWTMFKVKGTATGKGYYTDKNANSANSDYCVTEAGGADALGFISYTNFADRAGSIDDKGQAVANENATALARITADKEQTVTVRIWYEGCDKDCVSENAMTGIDHAITGNIGFIGVTVTTPAPGVGG